MSKLSDKTAIRELFTAGSFDTCLTHCRSALTRMPDDPFLLHVFCLCLLKLEPVPQAIAAIRKAVMTRPQDPHLHNLLGIALAQAKLYREALSAFEAAVQADPHFYEGRRNRGIARLRVRDWVNAEIDLLWSLARQPSDADGWRHLVVAYSEQGKLEAAIEAWKHLPVPRTTAECVAHRNLATACEAWARADLATEVRRKLVDWCGDSSLEIQSEALVALHYWQGDQPELLRQEHIAVWDHTTIEVKRISPDAVPWPRRPLRIGYVSGDFRASATGRFIEPILEAHRSQTLTVICYSTCAIQDAATRRMKSYVKTWRDHSASAEEDMKRQILCDDLDVIVDLSGHLKNPRLALFAQRLAPVQVTYLGYPNTTGLTSMDYRITDALADPPGLTEAHYTERLWRLPVCAWSYLKQKKMEPKRTLARKANARFYFGCLNRLAKLNPTTVSLWGRILDAVPRADLVLPMPSSTVSDSLPLLQTLHRWGLPMHRVKLLPKALDHSGYLRHYLQIDVALDPYPYHGTTTTCDALWMNVPVITWAGPTHVSRVGASLLDAVRLPELVADSPEAYFEAAVSLATQPDRLQATREKLSQQVLTSSLFNSRALGEELAAAYLGMLQNNSVNGSAET